MQYRIILFQLKVRGYVYKINSLSEREVRQRVDRNMKYYNEERIQEKSGYQAPKGYGSMAA
jgi:putative transposase